MAQDTRPNNEVLEDLYSRTDALVDQVRLAIRDGDMDSTLCLQLNDLHVADYADVLERLSSDERRYFVKHMGQCLDGDVLTHLDDIVLKDILEILNSQEIATFVQDLESDDAVEIIENLEEHTQRDVLQAVNPEDCSFYQESLSYPEESAGRIMQQEVLTIDSRWTVGETIDYMRDQTASLPERFYNVIVVNGEQVPVGCVPLAMVLRSKRSEQLIDLIEDDLKVIPPTMNRGDVAFLFRQYGLTEIPVVNTDGVLLGIINIDDIVDILDEEHEDNILHLGGVAEDDFYADSLDTVKSRVPWLFVNLLTAILASLVIGVFAETLKQAVALAILMPIVASMGGNAGTQTLTVAVRALATNELTHSNALRIVGKEVIVGGVNGLIFAVVTGAVAWLWFGDGHIGGIIALAMVFNLLIAGLVGTMVPLILDHLKLDPAIASTVFVTTVTDVVGFFTFLFLATVFL